MFKDNKSSFGPRPMVQGNWKCSDCGKEITEMPFEPSADRPIYCRDCWSKNKTAKTGQRRNDFGSRPMVQGNWKCSDCGKEITEMPFEPSADRPIYCRDCWAKNKPQRFDR